MSKECYLLVLDALLLCSTFYGVAIDEERWANGRSGLEYEKKELEILKLFARDN